MKNPIATASFKNLVAALSLLLLSSALMAQVGIGILTPDPSAQLDITSGSKGLLIPRMTSAARSSISLPATGLLVYQTDAPAGFYYFDGTTWNPVGTSALIGFSGQIASSSVSANTTFTGWNTTFPFYNSGSFNAVTGQFTVPSTGTYAITAMLNYKTTASVSVSLGAGVNPFFEVTRTSPSAATLLQANFPVLDVNIALVLSLRSILGGGVVNLAGTIDLTAGDVITLQYNANGLTLPLNLGNGLGSGVVWSVTRIH